MVEWINFIYKSNLYICNKYQFVYWILVRFNKSLGRNSLETKKLPEISINGVGPQFEMVVLDWRVCWNRHKVLFYQVF